MRMVLVQHSNPVFISQMTSQVQPLLIMTTLLPYRDKKNMKRILQPTIHFSRNVSWYRTSEFIELVICAPLRHRRASRKNVVLAQTPHTHPQKLLVTPLGVTTRYLRWEPPLSPIYHPGFTVTVTQVGLQISLSFLFNEQNFCSFNCYMIGRSPIGHTK